jgi:hypothetical protein
MILELQLFALSTISCGLCVARVDPTREWQNLIARLFVGSLFEEVSGLKKKGNEESLKIIVLKMVQSQLESRFRKSLIKRISNWIEQAWTLSIAIQACLLLDITVEKGLLGSKMFSICITSALVQFFIIMTKQPNIYEQEWKVVEEEDMDGYFFFPNDDL